MNNALAPLLVLALAVFVGGCGKAPTPPAPSCLERLAKFHSCSSDTAGNWKLVDTCNDAPPPFFDVHGCEDVSWVGHKDTRHVGGTMLCTSSGSCSSVTTLSGDSTMILSESCLFGLAHAFNLDTDLPPNVCKAVETSLSQLVMESSCAWDAKVCTCQISQVVKDTGNWVVGDAGMVSRDNIDEVQTLCVQGAVLAVESTAKQGQADGHDVHTIWLYQH